MTGPECLRGGNDEIDRTGGGLMVRRVDVETARADRVEPALAFAQPVGLGELFERKFGSLASEQRGDGRAIVLAGFAREIGVEPPGVGLVLGDLEACEDYAVIPVRHGFLPREGGLDERFAGEGAQFPARHQRT